MSDHPDQPESRLYLIQCEETGRIKIGLSMNPERRLHRLQTGSPTELRLLASVPGSEQLEREIHQKCDDFLVRGEWFEPGVADHLKSHVSVTDAFRYMANDLRTRQNRRREHRRHGRLFRVRRGRLLQAPNGEPWVLSSNLTCPSCNADAGERNLGSVPSGQVATCRSDCSRKWLVVRDFTADQVTDRWAFWTRNASDKRPLALDSHLWSKNNCHPDRPPSLDKMDVLLVARDRCENFCDRPVGVGSEDYLRNGDHDYCSGCDALNKPPPPVATIPHPSGGDPIDCEVTDALRAELAELL